MNSGMSKAFSLSSSPVQRKNHCGDFTQAQNNAVF